MANERITEDFVREHFKCDPLFGAVRLDEQKTTLSKAKACLSTASKSLTGKAGSPEFIISFPALPDAIIVVECKADAKLHRSNLGDDPVGYAVDGALHYSACLAQQYNVISIAVSGCDLKSLKISTFYQSKGSTTVLEEDEKLLGIFSYIERFAGDTQAKNIESAEITKTAIDLNNDLNTYSIAEYERCTLISAILLALQNKAFKGSYKNIATSKELTPTPERVAKAILTGIGNVLEDNEIDAQRVKSMLGEFQKIKNHPISKSAKIKKKKAAAEEDNYVLRDLTERLETSILPLISLGEKGYDVLGRFYREFIRYAGTDQKTGLVLTPQHITEFFGDVVHLNVNDVVYDSCCGTGGFLIAAMKKMLLLAGNDAKKKGEIKKNQLVGIEKRTDMFTFACSNMMMSGDGKSHIYQGDSFSTESAALIEELKPTVAFLNPPYDVGEDGQLEFIEGALSRLQPGGRCAAVVQMSCATSTGKAAVLVRERLLKSHKLTGVFSMPDDLFHPVGVVTCIMVFEAHSPHPASFKTFFGYFKDDGFRKTKTMGRVDQGDWATIKAKWQSAYINRENIPGLSVLKSVTASDEWCAEAYMETDISTFTEANFVDSVRKYVGFEFLTGLRNSASSGAMQNKKVALNFKTWQAFPMSELFKVASSRDPLVNLLSEGKTPYVSSTEFNNGVSAYVDLPPANQGNVLTVNRGGSVGKTFYQADSFLATPVDVRILKPKFSLNKFIALFLTVIIEREKYRFNYSRKMGTGRINALSIKLPASANGKPDFAYMENYIKALPYSASL
ncbi:N-6 DNA methylase [Lysobacter zhanggongensis]|uniref:site-specific DNA-methyltransferase (adenine-specific) n=1 Tax=Lysobacter zhanggongensis TaxID=1774951 RepID=A0ABU7YMV4_9GAMM